MPKGRGTNPFTSEREFNNAVKSGGFYDNVEIPLDRWQNSVGTALTVTLTASQAQRVVTSDAFTLALNADAGTTTVNTTHLLPFAIPDTFAQDEAKLKLRLLVVPTNATITFGLTATMRTWSPFGATTVKSAIGTLATRRWDAAQTLASGYNAQTMPLGTPTASGTTSLTTAANGAIPAIYEFDFTPAATTARTNYPKAGDHCTIKLVGVASATNASDKLTILRSWVVMARHAGMYRQSERYL